MKNVISCSSAMLHIINVRTAENCTLSKNLQNYMYLPAFKKKAN